MTFEWIPRRQFIICLSQLPKQIFELTNSLSLCLLSCQAHTTPEEFENGALFLRLGLPSTLTVTKAKL